MRLFLNSIDHQLDLVRAAGVGASRERQETEQEIVKAAQEQLDAADRYAEALGLAFQTRDDMLDVLGDSGKMGKATGMDENKNTFVRLYGVGACSRLIEKETQKSIEALTAFEDSDFLKELSMKLAIREC